MQYKGARRPLPEIARELGVDGILEGSVERSGDKGHMTVQLIRGRAIPHIWAESYDRDAGRAWFRFRRKLRERSQKKLNSVVVEQAPQRYVSSEAHDAYLRGRYLWFAGKNEEAGKYFRKATELQTDYAPGWAGLYDPTTVRVPAASSTPRIPLRKERRPPARQFALERALLRGGTSRWERSSSFSGTGCGQIRRSPRAIELDPNFGEAYHFRSKVLSAFGRNEEAIEAEKSDGTGSV